VRVEVLKLGFHVQSVVSPKNSCKISWIVHSISKLFFDILYNYNYAIEIEELFFKLENLIWG
jgi:hypothetical protein